MNWRRWIGLEKRQASGFTDALVSMLQARAGGVAVDPGALGALEVAAGLWSRGLASASVSPASPVSAAVTPAVLAAVGRGLIRSGEAVFLLEVDNGGRLRLLEASGWDISGGADPGSWAYRADLSGPGGTESRVSPASGVCHFRLYTEPGRPWKGVSPLEWARQTGQLAAFLETRLSEEASGPVGHLLPIPQDGADDNLEQLRKDLANLGGSVSLVETVSGGWGEGRAAAPRRDWMPQRIGANVPESSVDLRSEVSRTVLGACGVPPVLADSSGDGSARREAWRQFLHGTLQPVSKIIADELRDKLEVPGLSLGFADLFASDLAGRARAFGSMTDEKLSAADAARLCGFDLSGSGASRN